MGRHAAEREPIATPVVTVREMPDMAEVRARHRNAAMAGEAADHASQRDGVSIPAAVTRSWQDVSDLHDSLRLLAADLLAFAQYGGMPDSYWLTDRRVARACAVLGIDPVDARDQIDWAEVVKDD